MWRREGLSDTPRPRADTPLQRYGELFVDVQMLPLFADSKTFADATPRRMAAPALCALYARTKTQPGFSLAEFVQMHFDVDAPAALETEAINSPRLPLREHIRSLWPQWVRHANDNHHDGGSLLPLPHAYVVPGGRFREMYGWDSYFTMLGLVEDGQHELARGMLRNIAHQIDTLGHMPNGNRSYLSSRSQPPLFHRMVRLVHADAPAGACAQYLPQLRREHAYWMAGEAGLEAGASSARANTQANAQASAHVVRLPDGALLNRYFDAAQGPREESYREDVRTAAACKRPAAEVWRDLRAAAESGWDFSSRWCAQPLSLASIETTNLLPIDLNSLLWGLESAIQQGCVLAGDSGAAEAFALRARMRRAAIDRWLWHEPLGHFIDFHWAAQRACPALTAAALMPLYVGAANAEQARRTALAVQAQLLGTHGLLSTTQVSGQQWDAPNGWAPLQWMAVMGLRRYGHAELAEAIAARWLATVQRVYARTGRLLEKYDVSANHTGGGGEYPTQDGFGWTNGVTAALAALYPTLLRPESG